MTNKNRIARPYWNIGICPEAMQLILSYCINVKGFTTLWGTYFMDNPASGHIMEKLGFIPTGEETVCPNLEVGNNKTVRVMKLDKMI